MFINKSFILRIEIILNYQTNTCAKLVKKKEKEKLIYII